MHEQSQATRSKHANGINACDVALCDVISTGQSPDNERSKHKAAQSSGEAASVGAASVGDPGFSPEGRKT